MSDSKIVFEHQFPDRSIQIDSQIDYLKFVAGETAYFTTRNVVDLQMTKNYSDNSKEGTIVLTNLRLIFSLDLATSVNISIGYSCVEKILVGNINPSSKTQKLLIEQDRTLVVTCEENSDTYRFEFLPRGSKSIFDLFESIYRAYDTSKLYRKLRIKQAVEPDELLLKDEVCNSTLQNVLVLSPLSPIAVQGVLYFTNFRLFWHAGAEKEFNFSLPFIEIIGIERKEQVFNKDEQPIEAVLIQAISDQKTIVFALRAFGVDESELFDKIKGCCNNAFSSPEFGVQISKPQENEDFDGFVEIEPREENFNGFKEIISQKERVEKYLRSRETNKNIVFDENYGIAYEEIEGCTLDELWAM